MIKNNYLLTLRSGGEAAERRPERPNNLLLREHFLRPTSSTLACKYYIVVIINTIIMGSILNWKNEIISKIFSFYFKSYRRRIKILLS